MTEALLRRAVRCIYHCAESAINTSSIIQQYGLNGICARGLTRHTASKRVRTENISDEGEREALHNTTRTTICGQTTAAVQLRYHGRYVPGTKHFISSDDTTAGRHTYSYRQYSNHVWNKQPTNNIPATALPAAVPTTKACPGTQPPSVPALMLLLLRHVRTLDPSPCQSPLSSLLPTQRVRGFCADTHHHPPAKRFPPQRTGWGLFARARRQTRQRLEGAAESQRGL